MKMPVFWFTLKDVELHNEMGVEKRNPEAISESCEEIDDRMDVGNRLNSSKQPHDL